MNFFQKLFSKKQEPDNKLLIFLIKKWWNDRNDENYKNVVTELLTGNSFLLVPSVNEGAVATKEWKRSEGDTQIQFHAFNLDGLKVLGAFTDEKSLLKWSSKPTQYTGLYSKDLLKICEEKGFDRVVINSNADDNTLFFLERGFDNIEYNIPPDTKIKIGHPANPLPKEVLEKFVSNFKKLNTVNEAYQYLQGTDNEISIVIGILLNKQSENAKKAVIAAINNSIAGFKFDKPIDVFFIPNESWLRDLKKINNSLFYKNE